MQRSLRDILTVRASQATLRKVRPTHFGNSGLSSKIEEPVRTITRMTTSGRINVVQRWNVKAWEWRDA